jgi:hypothetical protein
MAKIAKTMEEWIETFSNKCFKENTYAFHPYGIMIIKPNKKEVVCFYPIINEENEVSSFIVNTFKIKYYIDENTWYRECANHNYAENCTQHRWYDKKKAFKIYTKYVTKM